MSAHLEEEYPESNKTLRAFVYPEPIARLEPSAVSYLPVRGRVAPRSYLPGAPTDPDMHD